MKIIISLAVLIEVHVQKHFFVIFNMVLHYLFFSWFKMRNSLDISVLVEKTIEVLKKKDKFEVDSLSEYHLSPRKKESLWGEICVAYFGEFDFTKSSAIQRRWLYSRNKQNGYFSLVKASLSALNKSNFQVESLNEPTSEDNKSDESDSLTEQFERFIVFSQDDWKSFNKMITIDTNQRRYYKTEFINIISRRLQKSGIPCWLKEKYNWFLKSYGADSKKPAWNAKLYCIECGEIFRATINKFNDKDDVSLCISWNNPIKHAHVQEKIICNGEARNVLKRDIALKGTLNTSDDNIIYNNQSDEIQNGNDVFILLKI